VAEEVLRLDGDSADGWATMALIEHALGNAEGGLAAYGEAISRSQKPELHSAYLISMQYVAGVDEQEIFEAHRNWNEIHGKPVANDTSWPHIEFDPKRRLRVGFVSSDFRQSSTPYLTLEMLDHRPEAKWSLVCYANRFASDAMTEEFKKRADGWRVIAGMSDDEVAGQVREDGIDILFDLNGHTYRNRLGVFARKPAPVQVAWLDYVATSGLDTMDYYFGDALHTPPSDQPFFTEKIRELPVSYIRYRAPIVAPDIAPLPATLNGHITFGCFNSAYKISPPVIDSWVEILERVPESRLLLNAKEFAAVETCRRFEDLFVEKGIDIGRVKFLSGSKNHREFLATYNRIDIGLDTFPYSGGVTTLEALHMGVPVVTFTGSRMCARHSSAHMTIAGLADWIAADRGGYVALAVAKAGDMDGLAALRRTLRRQLGASPLTDGAGLAEGFTGLLRDIWGEACRGH
jgi:predicted O-linked N-acetylglucosamine transferase (SPINDLY family)